MKQGDELLQEALDHFEAMDHVTAELLFKEFLQDHPEHLQAQTLYTIILLERGVKEPVRKIIQHMRTEWPDEAHGHYLLARLHLVNSSDEMAVETLQHATELAPESPWLGLFIAQLWAQMGWTSWAKIALAPILKQHPENEPALHLLIQLDLIEENPIPARQNFEKFLKIHPDHPDAPGILAKLLQIEGDEASAQETASWALGQDIDNPMARDVVLDKLMDQGAISGAAMTWERIWRKIPWMRQLLIGTSIFGTYILFRLWLVVFGSRFADLQLLVVASLVTVLILAIWMITTAPIFIRQYVQHQHDKNIGLSDDF